MSMVLSEEQHLLKETMGGVMNKSAPVRSLRALRDSRDALGYSPELWRQLVDLGIPSISLPASSGGLGFGFVGLGSVMEEAGRTLAASPLFSTVVLGLSLIHI